MPDMLLSLRRRALFSRLILLGSLVLPGAASGSSITVRPTSTPADFGNVRDALRRLSPGDTLRLGAGVFDWSANVSDTSEAVLLPGGLKVPVSGVTIMGVQDGRRETVIRGATDSRGGPLLSDVATNAAFRNAPGVQNVTLKSMTLENFESAIVLLQADSLGAARPVNAFRAGTTGWRIEDITIRSGPFGIVANGRHTGLVVRRCRFEMRRVPSREVPGTTTYRGGSFAIGLRPFPPFYSGLPARAVIEGNVIRGPEVNTGGEMFGGMIVTCDSALIRRNDVERYALGLVVEGRGLVVSENQLSGCGIGIVAWTTNRLGTKTEHALLRRNEIRGMTRGAAGILREYMGCGIVLAGVTDSDISDNIFSANPSADIAIGAVETTPVSKGNHIHGNGGKIVLSKRSFEQNKVEGSQVTVRDMSPPKPAGAGAGAVKGGSGAGGAKGSGARPRPAARPKSSKG